MNVYKSSGAFRFCVWCVARDTTHHSSEQGALPGFIAFGAVYLLQFPFWKKGLRRRIPRSTSAGSGASACLCVPTCTSFALLSLSIYACNMNAPGAARARPNINRTSTMPFGAGNNPVTLRILCYRPPKTRLPPRRPVMNEKRIYYRPALCALYSLAGIILCRYIHLL